MVVENLAHNEPVPSRLVQKRVLTTVCSLRTMKTAHRAAHIPHLDCPERPWVHAKASGSTLKIGLGAAPLVDQVGTGWCAVDPLTMGSAGPVVGLGYGRIASQRYPLVWSTDGVHCQREHSEEQHKRPQLRERRCIHTRAKNGVSGILCDPASTARFWASEGRGDR